MAPIIFFLAGIPAAFLLNRAIAALVEGYEEEETPDPDEQGGAAAAQALVWQVGAWPARVRFLVSSMAPPLMAAAAWQFEPLQAAFVSLFILAMLLCTGTDLIAYRVPNVVTYPATVLALLAALVLPGGEPLSAALASLGAAGVFLVLWVLTRGGMGLGDVKLAMLIGAGLGFPAVYAALMLGVIAAGLTILLLLVLRLVSRSQPVPYAPFLALAAVAVVLQQGASFAPL
jgi:prepilin signal peptidase PulO-like enzyme (type II secretory pathway)